MILFIMATGYLQLPDKRKWEKHWSIRGLTIFSALSFLINIANIIHGSLNTSSNSFGSHNTMADLVPIAIILTGTGLWLLTIKRSVVTSVLKC
jgi:surface polysaccharide O-acyltransferase-like enzyme